MQLPEDETIESWLADTEPPERDILLNSYLNEFLEVPFKVHTLHRAPVLSESETRLAFFDYGLMPLVLSRQNTRDTGARWYRQSLEISFW